MGGGYDFAGIHSILVDPRDPAHVTVGVSVGGVWTTKDGGANWALIGSGLIVAGTTRWCGMARLVALMPWNRKSGCPEQATA